MIKRVLIINGVERTIVIQGDETLAQVLRDRLLLTGCKIGCGEGHCGEDGCGSGCTGGCGH